MASAGTIIGIIVCVKIQISKYLMQIGQDQTACKGDDDSSKLLGKGQRLSFMGIFDHLWKSA